MFARYRLAYLSVATALVGGVVFVSAATDPAKPRRSNLLLAAAEQQKEKEQTPSVASDAPANGYEKGNLAEVGARELLTVSDYERAVAISKSKPVLVFKHSTECEISGAAYRRVAAWAKEKGTAAPGLFLVKVIERKPLSQEIAARSKIEHESPQVILFVNAKPVWNASHEAITSEAIDAALQAAASQPKQTD